ADGGADVTTVEDSESPAARRSPVRYDVGDNGPNAYFETRNRNKRGIVLGLKAEAGQRVFYRLVETADVVVQNFRPGVCDRLGIDYSTLSNVNPRLIYGQASVFGL